jgi:HEPN domain-containing protein
MSYETRQVLNPAVGMAREIGFYLAGMDEVREQLREAVRGISNADIGRLAVPETHSIGALVLHIGEAEWWWMQCNVAGHKLTEEDARTAFWDVLKEPERVASNGYSAEFCLAEADRIREQTRGLLASFAVDNKCQMTYGKWLS